MTGAALALLLFLHPAHAPRERVPAGIAGGGGTGETVGLLGRDGGSAYGGGIGRLSVRHPSNAAEEKARSLAKGAVAACFGGQEGRVVMRVKIDAQGHADSIAQSNTAPAAVVECLKKEIRGWKLPATPGGAVVTLELSATP